MMERRTADCDGAALQLEVWLIVGRLACLLRVAAISPLILFVLVNQLCMRRIVVYCNWRSWWQISGFPLRPSYRTAFFQLPRVSTMATKSHQPKGHDSALSTLDVIIQALTLAKDTCGIPPAQAAFGSAGILLTMIRVRSFSFGPSSFQLTLVQDTMINKQDYVELGLSCADVCQTLERGLSGRRLNELNQPVIGAIGKLTTWVASVIRMRSSPLTRVSTIIGLWPRFGARSPHGINEAQYLGSSMRRATRM
jgi:hypothetical protein